ncbi:MAG: succinyl-diaminopimelate desuccinylase [Acidimicrobiaceae bacterium]|nr:succinyl-diaminopimelate desuccinylase [Acidimicrobiaceae bacterium]
MTTLEDVLALVAIDSVSTNESALAKYVYEHLIVNSDLEVERIGDNVIARSVGLHSFRVLVAGHLDTVPGDVTASVIEGDVLHGLGACDMKGSLAGMIDLALDKTPRPVEVTWVFYAREEISRSQSGLLEIAELRPDLLVADVAVLAEPTGGRVEAGCQGTLRIKITLGGARAHTARPFTGRNAIHRLGDLLSFVALYQPREVQLEGVTYVEQLQAVSVEGGVAPNVVPDVASCVLNHRVAPDRTLDQAVQWLRDFLGELLDEQDVVEVKDWAPSASPELMNPHLTRLVEISGETPQAKVGWTDVATFREFGIPATNFGAGDPLRAHRSDEYVTTDEVNRFASVLGEWLRSTPNTSGTSI